MPAIRPDEEQSLAPGQSDSRAKPTLAVKLWSGKWDDLHHHPFRFFFVTAQHHDAASLLYKIMEPWFSRPQPQSDSYKLVKQVNSLYLGLFQEF